MTAVKGFEGSKGSEISEGVETHVVARDQIPADLEGLDIGPSTRASFTEEVSNFEIFRVRTMFRNTRKCCSPPKRRPHNTLL